MSGASKLEMTGCKVCTIACTIGMSAASKGLADKTICKMGCSAFANGSSADIIPSKAPAVDNPDDINLS